MHDMFQQLHNLKLTIIRKQHFILIMYLLFTVQLLGDT